MELQTEILAKHHFRDDFSSGQESLDNYLKKQVNQDIRKRISVCFVLVDKINQNKIKGYYTLSNSSIPRTYLPEILQKKFPQSYKTIPTTLIGRLARDLTFRKQGIGEKLLIDALYRSFLVAKELGSFAVVVDPIDNFAVDFYTSYGFILLPDSGKMFLPMKTIEQLFEK